MRVAFIIGSLTGGGAERVVSILATKMADEGHSIEIILIASNKISYPISKSVKIVDCSTHYSVRGMSFLKRTQDIRAEIKRFDADVVVSFTVAVNFYGILACLPLKSKLIICERNDPRFDPKDKKSRLLRKILYRFSDGYVFQTSGERDFFGKSIIKKSAIIPNPLSPNLPDIYKGQRSKKIVMVGRLESQKNYHLAISALVSFLSLNPDYYVDIYGSGALKPVLTKEVDEVNLAEKIKFNGQSNNVLEEIKDASIFLMTSDYEGLSNSMLEALALGIPVVCTDYPSGGARDFIKEGVNGFLAQCGNKDEVIRCLNMAMEIEFDKVFFEQVDVLRECLCINSIYKKWEAYIEGVCYAGNE